jgi:hypothetical protein
MSTPAASPRPLASWFVALATFLLLLLHVSSFAADRHSYRAKSRSRIAAGLTFTSVSIPAPLIQCLLGNGVQTRNATLTTATDAAGTFTGGTSIVGFEEGLVLGTGVIQDAAGPNQGASEGTDNAQAGDADLDALVTPDNTYDATILDFEFFTAAAQAIEFQYVFSSEEYSEFVGAGFDDVVAFFLNGNAASNNIARVPTGCGGTAGIPVSVDNVNCGNVGDPLEPAVNCGCYIDNEIVVPPPPDSPVNLEMDGLTHVFTASGTSVAGWNHLKIAIADSGDGILDSNVFIRCLSFVVPTHKSSWGQIKTLYR